MVSYWVPSPAATGKTDAQYTKELVLFTEFLPESVKQSKIRTYIDPAAASMRLALQDDSSRRFRVIPARNEVIDGIRDTAVCMEQGYIRIFDTCKNLIKELAGYVWEENECGDDRPVKVNDHAVDAMRYFCRSKGLVHKHRKGMQ